MLAHAVTAAERLKSSPGIVLGSGRELLRKAVDTRQLVLTCKQQAGNFACHGHLTSKKPNLDLA